MKLSRSQLLALALLTVGVITLGAIPAAKAQTIGAFLGPNPSGKFGHHDKSFDQQFRSHTQSQSQVTPSVFPAECPVTVHCVVKPAAYSSNNGNVGDYGNYDHANRPADISINTIVVHDTEGSLQSTLDAFQDSTFYASAHYVIDTDGTIYQMVPTKDIAWHAGNWSTNMHSIAIEHVGHAADSQSYTPQMYYASEQLVKYLSAKFNIPRDRAHIIGHDNVPAPKSSAIATMHVDPGPFWNWEGYTHALGSPVLPSFDFTSNLVTIAPHWPANKQPVTGCSNDSSTPSCVPDGLQPTNFVYLHTDPSDSSPLLTDTVLGQGTTEISNNAARLFYGQTLAIADRRIDWQGIWYQVWVNGIKGWFYSAWTQPTAFMTTGSFATPKTGSPSIAVYGRATPELSEYPTDLISVPPASTYIPAPSPLAYTLTNGQRYRVISTHVPTDYYYTWASDSSFPYDHTVFRGATKYVEIQLGNRIGFVKAADVDIH